jgi:serine palmitoyltransferase
MENLEALHPVIKDMLLTMNTSITAVAEFYSTLPFSSALLRYIKNSYQHDPMRVLIELALVVFMVKYLMTKAYKIGNREVELTTQVTFCAIYNLRF